MICDVWWARIDVADPRLDRLLTPADHERIARFRQPADRDRGQVAWALARLLLAERLGTDPAAVPVDRTCQLCGCGNGKPFVVGPPTPIDFSLSHSGDYVAVAITGGTPVGVDIERLRVAPVDDGLLRSVLAPDEMAALTDRAGLSLDDAFIRLWVRKEAVVKAMRTGLRTPMPGFSVAPAGQPAALLAWAEDPTLPSRTTLADLAGRPGHLGAVAIFADGAEIREHDGTALLQGV